MQLPWKKNQEPEPTSDPRDIALAAKHQNLDTDSLERRGFQSAVTEATATRERCHGALSRILHDPMTFATTPASDLEAAKKALLDAMSDEERAIAALRDHEQKTGDLGERAKQLAAEETALHNDRVWAEDRGDAAEILEHGRALAILQNRIVQRRFSERDARLYDFSWPPGVFDSPADSRYDGDNLMVRSLWFDHVRLGIALAFPDLLPDGEGAAIARRVASEKARGAPGRWFPIPSSRWDVFPYRRF